MGVPSFAASNAIIYLTYGAFLAIGLYIAWRLRRQSKTEWLSSNGTQKGIPLALNFIASGECNRTIDYERRQHAFFYLTRCLSVP
ncbi:hypothetical protein M501DRAFT_1003570 [Patellaria atrata CBS 101060]|uniref:Uncharacterized protein n=1 Tax=Patellaria atrata CBS 101060 TaxID=1346257 RepID=A0A9P4SAD1_9PEZI|nr:hypothetical protein M501DRAFT_1003570 [Patellaria atrata CBS 101060]